MTWGLPSDRLWAKGAEDSASVSGPACVEAAEGAGGWEALATGGQWGGAGPQAGGAPPLAQQAFPPRPAPKSEDSYEHPSPTTGRTRRHCCLAMACSLWAGDGAQSRHHIRKHFLFMSGSLWGESQG